MGRLQLMAVVLGLALAGPLPARATTVVAVDPGFAPVASVLLRLFTDSTGHAMVLSVAPESHAGRSRRHPPAVPRRAEKHRVPQAAQAAGAAGARGDRNLWHDPPGDRWLVCLSGGKDSYTLLAILHELKWRGLLPVDLLACNLDQGQPGFPATVLPEFLTRMGVPHRIEYQDTYSVVVDKIAPGGPCVRCVRGCGAATCTASRARRVFDRGAGPSPRRHSGNLFHEPVPRRAAGHHAAQAAERGGRSVRLRPLAWWPRPIATASPGR
jgi:hypothetical protein